MPEDLRENTDIDFAALAPVFDEYVAWFADVMRFCASPADGKKPQAHPEAFTHWLKESAFPRSFDELTQHVNESCKAFHAAADDLLAAPDSSEKFKNAVTAHEKFLSELRRLEKALIHDGTGVDAITGLRDLHALEIDFERQQERMRRYKYPFALILAKIDNYEEMRDAAEEVEFRRAVKEMAFLIRKHIRTFDDAYWMDNGEFVINCKHTGRPGGSAAIRRLQKYYEEEKVALTDRDGNTRNLTLSCIVSEPVPGDKVTDLVDHMREDLERFDQDEGVNIEHYEESPLARYLKSAE